MLGTVLVILYYSTPNSAFESKRATLLRKAYKPSAEARAVLSSEHLALSLALRRLYGASRGNLKKTHPSFSELHYDLDTRHHPTLQKTS